MQVTSSRGPNKRAAIVLGVRLLLGLQAAPHPSHNFVGVVNRVVGAMESGTCLVIGLNSGTSMDGIDACIVQFTEDPADTVPAPRYVDRG